MENAFDKAIESADDENEKKLEQLEDYWSDSRIAELISQSLQTGVFKGVDGTVINLQDALVKFAKESGETFGVMGAVVKDELVTNLGIALDTLKNYSEVMGALELKPLNTTVASGLVSSKSVSTGDISINIATTANVNEQDIANKVKDAINEVLEGTVQGL